MLKLLNLVFLVIFFISLTMCSDNNPVDDLLTNDSEDLAHFTLLNGSNFIFHVNKIVDHPHVQFPFDELRESDYIKTNDNKQYQVYFSAQIDTVILMPDSISGRLLKDTYELKQYTLEDGLFAGGRFIVWIMNRRCNQFD